MSKSNLILLGEEGKTIIYNSWWVFLKYTAVVIFLIINFTAVSIALLCHQNDSLFTKIFVSIFAFMFGFIYILFNYYSYRVLMKGQVCSYSGEVFPF
jgi:hypothetical protein